METINWRTKIQYVDLETGEQITEAEAKKSYVVINTKKKSHVYKNTGTIEITKECKTSSQLRLFNE